MHTVIYIVHIRFWPTLHMTMKVSSWSKHRESSWEVQWEDEKKACIVDTHNK
jgi:hypothetical protein